MIIDTAKASPESLYKLLTGSVLPRPIAWVSTVSDTGISNLAPFSFFTVASTNPPVICFAPSNKKMVVDGKAVPKDTLRNIRQTKEFVVNIVSRKLAEKMCQTSGEYAADISEFKAVEIETAACQVVRPFRVAEALISMECRLRQVIEFGGQPGAGNLVLGDVLRFHLHESVYLEHDKINLDVLDPVGRLSGHQYCFIETKFSMDPPKLD
ncbi:MAG: flavin reductase family protein [Candidatus Obscuribacterales bacterium]|nr:flavin reductase family protein [Candidatus Obscuribacterales bacterium]